jgi:hypothetical protein
MLLFLILSFTTICSEASQVKWFYKIHQENALKGEKLLIEEGELSDGEFSLKKEIPGFANCSFSEVEELERDGLKSKFRSLTCLDASQLKTMETASRKKMNEKKKAFSEFVRTSRIIGIRLGCVESLPFPSFSTLFLFQGPNGVNISLGCQPK